MTRLAAVLMALTFLGGPLVAQDPLEVLWSQPAKGSGALSFSPDGRFLATAQDGVHVWRVADGTSAGTMSGSLSMVASLSFSPDSLQLASGDGNGVVRVHNVWDGSLAWYVPAAGDVTQVEYSTDGKLASWSSDRHAIVLLRGDTGQLCESYDGCEWSHYNVAFSPDGTLAAIGGDTDPSIKLLSTTNGSCVRVLTGHTARVRTVVFCCDSATLATAGDDGSIRIWRISDGSLLRSLPGHTNGVWKIAAAPNSTLASTGNDGTVRLWRLSDGALLRAYSIGLGASFSLEFSPDGSAFAFERSGEIVLARDPVPAITSQPNRLTRFAGQGAHFAASATGTGPLLYQWKHDGAAIRGATESTFDLVNLDSTASGLYSVQVANSLGTVESRGANLTILQKPMGPGSLDLSFDPSDTNEKLGFGGGLPGVRAALLEPDGRLVVGGFFAGVNGVSSRHLARLLQDGTLDPTFNPGLGFDGEITALARQPDGSVIVGGMFSAADGRLQGGLVRVDAFGRLDPGFRVALSDSLYQSLGSLSSLAVQSDGRIWICGSFDTVNGSACTNVARLKPDGTLDTSLDLEALGVHGNLSVDRILVQPDGCVLLAGCWTNPQCSLIRLKPNGTLDSSLNGPFANWSGWWSHIYGLATHSDGRIAIVGDFDSLNNVARNGVAWLLPDGTVDTRFDPGSGPEDSIARTVAIDPDGRLVVGGWFTVVQGATRRGFARFNTDGSLDETFDPGMAVGYTARPNINALIRQSDGRYLGGADDWDLAGTNCVLRLASSGARDGSMQVPLQVEGYELVSAALQQDGRLLAGGYFSSLNGIARPGLARLQTDGVVDDTFAPPTNLDIEVRTIAIQQDKKILVGGVGRSGYAGKELVRLNANGGRDSEFSGAALQGQNTMVEKIAVQDDGKILIGGLFSTAGGLPRSGIARLNANGSVDEGFVPPPLVTSDDPGYGVEFIHILSDRRILIAGGFTSSDGAMPHILRLQPDGRIDTAFAPELPENQPIRAMAVQNDGDILLAGTFQNGDAWGRLVRLLPNGAADPTFHPDVGLGVTALAVQADGRILVATNSMHAGSVVRLRADGTLDGLWRTSLGAPDSYMDTKALLAQPDGKALVLGQWQSISGIPRPGIARLNGDASACYLKIHDGFSPTNGFAFQFIGIDHGHFVVENSEDLHDWHTWRELVDPVSPLDLWDLEATAVPHRFFRARLVP